MGGWALREQAVFGFLAHAWRFSWVLTERAKGPLRWQLTVRSPLHRGGRGGSGVAEKGRAGL